MQKTHSISSYFDYTASQPPFSEALSAQAAAAERWYANPSATHPAGRAAYNALMRLRGDFSAVCNFDGRLLLTSGATEANNLVIHGIMRAHSRAEIVVAADVHSSIWEAARHYGRRMRVVNPRSDGSLSEREIVNQFSRRTVLFCCPHVSNETGVIHDAALMAARCRRLRVRCLIDGSQALGHIPVDLAAINSDYYVFSAHKFGGPRGFGGLFFREAPNTALLDGGRQQWGMRAGTENLPGLAGALTALRFSLESMDGEALRLRSMAVELIAGLRRGGIEMLVNGDPERGLPGFVSVSFPGINGNELMTDMAMRGFSVATGSACHADIIEPPRVILAMGRSAEEALGTLRISFGRMTSGADADALGGGLSDALKGVATGPAQGA